MNEKRLVFTFPQRFEVITFMGLRTGNRRSGEEKCPLKKAQWELLSPAVAAEAAVQVRGVERRRRPW